jgi:hypothetical protein
LKQNKFNEKLKIEDDKKNQLEQKDKIESPDIKVENNEIIKEKDKIKEEDKEIELQQKYIKKIEENLKKIEIEKLKIEGNQLEQKDKNEGSDIKVINNEIIKEEDKIKEKKIEEVKTELQSSKQTNEQISNFTKENDDDKKKLEQKGKNERKNESEEKKKEDNNKKGEYSNSTIPNSVSNKKVIVIDNGSKITKYGFSGDKSPKSSPNFVGTPKKNLNGNNTKVFKKNPNYDMVYPKIDGKIIDENKMLEILQNIIYNELSHKF